MWAKYIRLPSFAQIYPRGHILGIGDWGQGKEDAGTRRRGDTEMGSRGRKIRESSDIEELGNLIFGVL
jgi:hypothetical protein